MGGTGIVKPYRIVTDAGGVERHDEVMLEAIASTSATPNQRVFADNRICGISAP
jgi:hypothetical protein